MPDKYSTIFIFVIVIRVLLVLAIHSMPISVELNHYILLCSSDFSSLNIWEELQMFKYYKLRQSGQIIDHLM